MRSSEQGMTPGSPMAVTGRLQMKPSAAGCLAPLLSVWTHLKLRLGVRAAERLREADDRCWPTCCWAVAEAHGKGKIEINADGMLGCRGLRP